MKKTFLAFTLLLGLCTAVSGAETSVSDVALYNEINLAFKNHYYPGIVDKVNLMEKEYPDSVFLKSALAYKGDALISLNRYGEAVETLTQAIEHMHTGTPEITQCTYLLGKAFYYQKKYNAALEKFHLACSLALTDRNMEFYNPSVLYAGRTCYLLNEYEEACPLFEYVVANGNYYSSDDYNEVLQKLMLSYNRTGLFEKTISLYNQLPLENFENNLKFSICLYNADALKGKGDYKNAYSNYCQVMEWGNTELAVIALKKAYVLATENNIGVNPGEIFGKTVDTFKDNPQLVNEFWIRLGIDEYEKQNYSKAEEYFTNVPEENPVISFYKAKILIDRDKNVSGAEKLLLSIEGEVKKSKVENLSDAYYSLLLNCKFQQKKWNEIPAAFNKIAHPDADAVYALNASYYEKGEYKKVTSDSALLYASSLCKLGDFAAACQIFSDLSLAPENQLEYAKALFACGRYEQSYSQALLSSDLHREYVCGLCQINLKNWEKAKNHFASYIKQNSGSDSFIKLAFFYKGYAEYCLEEYKNSYASFVRFGSEADAALMKYTRKGYEYAAKSALQNGDFKNASIQAENIIRCSGDKNEKQDAVLFCAEILTDYERYDEALAILNPYTAEKSDFGAQAVFNSAKIYEKQEKLNLADESYKRVYTDYPKSSLAEEAMYRCGEVFYSSADYASALSRFNTYIYKYTNGKFLDAALFFGGESALKVGEIDRAIMLNKTMLQKFPDSIYSYGANKNLLNAYYEQESYSLALDVAKSMVKNFAEQSANDEIGRRLIELEKIVSGTDRKIAEKESDYEKLGKTSTKKGRAAGTQLVRLYAEDSTLQQKAFELAMELLQKQTEPDERQDAAENAEFIADYYRKNLENKEAAQMYLTAAEYYRSLNDSTRAAAVLYGAAEAFVADGLDGDGKETAELLKQLYPESRQAQRVDDLIK